MTGTDDSTLRDLLRAADPAAALEPLDDDRILRMTNLTTSDHPSTAPRRSHRRPVLIGLAGATGLAGIAAAAVFALSPAPMAATRLSLPADAGGAASMCMAVDAEFLKSFPMAFEARVDAIAGKDVTLTVTHVFKGDPGKAVLIEQPELTASDFSGFEFKRGEDYLISVADDGSPAPDTQIALCGFSGPATPELLAVYQKAFG